MANSPQSMVLRWCLAPWERVEDSAMPAKVIGVCMHRKIMIQEYIIHADHLRCNTLELTCHSIPQSKNTLLSEQRISAKNTSMKGTARGITPEWKQKHRGLSNSNVR